jgi:CDP-L-myo-inositol myo-inositolphosphotransferase
MTSAYGGFLDAILDRYADALIVLGLIIWAAGDDYQLRVWVIGFWALAGTFVVTYTRAKIESIHANVFDRGITAAATRDVRLFLVMVGGLVGQGEVTLVVLALLTNGVVLSRLLMARRVLAGK